LEEGFRSVDSDLAEAVAALKDIFTRRNIPATFSKAPVQLVDELRKALRVPARYRAFLSEADPVDVETSTPAEKVRLISSEKLAAEQAGTNGDATALPGWRKSWVVVARSALLGDPYFLDISKLDAEGDCPVYTCMLGTDSLKPELCASSFQQFLRILATSMEVATGFGESGLDDDDEAIFREALAPRIKTIDSAALRAGHWT
jgi:SMI1 / KNR4 family (SUKH-1)